MKKWWTWHVPLWTASGSSSCEDWRQIHRVRLRRGRMRWIDDKWLMDSESPAKQMPLCIYYKAVLHNILPAAALTQRACLVLAPAIIQESIQPIPSITRIELILSSFSTGLLRAGQGRCYCCFHAGQSNFTKEINHLPSITITSIITIYYYSSPIIIKS